MEDTATIYIIGAAAVLVSGVKLDDWKLVEKFAPEALNFIDEDSGEIAFRITCRSGMGSVNQYGVCWGSHTSDEGYATVTLLLDEDVEDKQEAVMEVIGPAMMYLEVIEDTIPGVLAEIKGNNGRPRRLL